MQLFALGLSILPNHRIRWMDFARGICILLVLFVHASAAISVVPVVAPEFLMLINDLFAPFRMPFLMFLSGQLLHLSLRKNISSYIYGKVLAIVWPFFLWSLFIYAAEGRFTIEVIAKTPITAPSVLWYLWFLFSYYIISYFLHHLKVPIVPIVITCLILSSFATDILRVNRFLYLFAFFLLGHLASYYPSRVYLSRAALFVAVGGVISGSYLSAFHFPIKYNPIYAWAPISLIILSLHYAESYRATYASSALEWIGRNSIVFYVSHFGVQVLIARLLGIINVDSPRACYFITFFGALMVGCILQLMRSRFRGIAFLFDLREVLGQRVRNPFRRRGADNI